LDVNFGNIMWVVFIAMAFLPMLRQQRLEVLRLKLVRRFEVARGSRLITMIHRQESISFLGIPLSRYINIEDSEAVLRAIRLTPNDMPIDLVLHTPGGLVLASEQIARALQKHPARVTVFVPHYAMSGGTMIAMAADEIRMDDNAVLGPPVGRVSRCLDSGCGAAEGHGQGGRQNFDAGRNRIQGHGSGEGIRILSPQGQNGRSPGR